MQTEPITLENLVRNFDTGEIMAVLVRDAGLRATIGNLMLLCQANAAPDVSDSDEERKAFEVAGEELENALERIRIRSHESLGAC